MHQCRRYPGCSEPIRTTCSHAHYLQVEKYRYFDPETVGLDFEGMLDDIRNAPEGSIILLHGRRN